MLREIKDVRQEPGAGLRRWFESEGFELVVWLTRAGEIDGFQICYDFGQGEHALTWRDGAGFGHAEVDDGEQSPFKNVTPVLVGAGNTPWVQITENFEARSASLDQRLRALVREKLAAGAAQADRSS